MRLTSAESLNRPIRASVVLKIVILAGSAHNFNFSVNSYMLVKVARLKTFEEVMKGKNSEAVVDRQENKARSNHR